MWPVSSVVITNMRTVTLGIGTLRPRRAAHVDSRQPVCPGELRAFEEARLFRETEAPIILRRVVGDEYGERCAVPHAAHKRSDIAHDGSVEICRDL